MNENLEHVYRLQSWVKKTESLVIVLRMYKSMTYLRFLLMDSCNKFCMTSYREVSQSVLIISAVSFQIVSLSKVSVILYYSHRWQCHVEVVIVDQFGETVYEVHYAWCYHGILHLIHNISCPWGFARLSVRKNV